SSDILILLLFCLFFFQAEDGIRDATVTGVQTCALPILSVNPRLSSPLPKIPRSDSSPRRPWRADRPRAPLLAFSCPKAAFCAARSEERRVGKECRYRGGT